ncbi:MAG: MarR family transcriptional regulator [Solirubrobacterales bacterium]|nr:MarR family transcriptional regulator [Solirubrobacterales bacterium]MCB0859884.1 MarR family transcriptional regulator [Solirubrobacterales bacterium]MCB0862796.1 MarR family transcriptional regulator [Solirubrobacterales bacterium]HRV59384.1 MarR family transcriptional regulator [Solirubrobacterales bacterium]
MSEPETNSQADSQTKRQTTQDVEVQKVDAHRDITGVQDRRAEADALRLAITRTARRLRQEAGGGLSPTLIATLASIERGKVLTPGELARIEGVQRPTMTRAINRLADAGLIDRREDPEDRRSALLSVSEEGHRYLAAHRSRKSAWLANLIEEMPADDADTLARAAEILSHALETHRTGELRLPGEDGNSGEGS